MMRCSETRLDSLGALVGGGGAKLRDSAREDECVIGRKKMRNEINSLNLIVHM
jgi:hypothetical protein